MVSVCICAPPGRERRCISVRRVASGRKVWRIRRRSFRSHGAAFKGYRLLQEYFALFRSGSCSFRYAICAARSRACEGDELELFWRWGARSRGSENALDATQFRLGCTPAVNLFTRATDRVHVNNTGHRIPRRAGSQPALGFRGPQSREAGRNRDRRGVRGAARAVLFNGSSHRPARRRRLLHRSAAAAPVVAARAAERGAIRLHRQRVLHLDRRFGAAAVHRDRSGRSMYRPCARTRDLPVQLATGQDVRISRWTAGRRSRRSVAVAGLVTRGSRLPLAPRPGTDRQPSFAQLSFARRAGTRSRCRDVAPTCSPCTRTRNDAARLPQLSDRWRAPGELSARRAAGADSRADQLWARPRNLGRDGRCVFRGNGNPVPRQRSLRQILRAVRRSTRGSRRRWLQSATRGDVKAWPVRLGSRHTLRASAPP